MEDAPAQRVRANRLGLRLGLVAVVLFLGPIAWMLVLKHLPR